MKNKENLVFYRTSTGKLAVFKPDVQKRMEKYVERKLQRSPGGINQRSLRNALKRSKSRAARHAVISDRSGEEWRGIRSIRSQFLASHKDIAKIIVPSDYPKDKKHENDPRVAKLIANRIGGKIRLRHEFEKENKLPNGNTKRSSDYRWTRIQKPEDWELKTAESGKPNTINKRVQDAMTQTFTTPRGFIVDITMVSEGPGSENARRITGIEKSLANKEPITRSNAVTQVRNRLAMSGTPGDIAMIIDGNTIVDVLQKRRDK